MSSQGSGRAPVFVGVCAAGMAIVVAGYFASRTLRLLREPRAAAAATVAAVDDSESRDRPAAGAPAAAATTPAPPGAKRRAADPHQAVMPPAAPAPSAPQPHVQPAPRRKSPPPAPVPLSPDALFARAAPAVVRINLLDDHRRPRGHGSGFVVSPDGLVVTSFRLMYGSRYATVRLTDGTVLEAEGVAAGDPKVDVVVIRVTPSAPLPALSLHDGRAPAVGTKVFAIGHPQGLKNVLSEGLISGRAQNKDRNPLLQTTAALSTGSAGGPLLNEFGLVVGMATSDDAGGQNLNFGVPAESMWPLVKQAQDRPMPIAVGGAGPRAHTPPATAHGPGAKTTGVTRHHASRSHLETVWEDLRFGRLREASELLTRMRDIGLDDDHYWYTVGCLHMRLRNFDVAADAFRKSIGLRDDIVAVHVRLGLACRRAEKLTEALAAFDAAIRLEPNDAEPCAAAGAACLDLKKPELAVPYLEKAAALAPKDDAHPRNLGRAHAAVGRTAQAEVCFRKACALDPADASNFAKHGSALVGLGRHDDAEAALKKALLLDPRNAEAYLWLGHVYHSRGDAAAAKAAWADADRFDRKGPHGRAARMALSSKRR